MIGDDVAALQERLHQMGYDVGRSDGIYGPRTARGVGQFQREVGLGAGRRVRSVDRWRHCAASTAASRVATPRCCASSNSFRHSGPTLVGKTIVIDPGHGGPDLGAVVPDGLLRWTESELAYDIATRLEGRLAAAGMRVHLTRGPRPDRAVTDDERAGLANELRADLLLSIHLEFHANPMANGVATYHYGSEDSTSTVGERLAGLVQREILARTDLRDCRTHAKTWDLLRLTRMPTVRVDVGYLTSPTDRAHLVDPMFREQIVEALIAAVQRMYLPVEQDVKTGSIDVSTIRAVQHADRGGLAAHDAAGVRRAADRERLIRTVKRR